MGYLSVNKDNRLFWLGRYHERVGTTLSYLLSAYDEMIDGAAFDYGVYCASLGIENRYTDARDFMRRYLFDKENPDSVRAAADRMMGNGIVLREAISSQTLSYLQMAVYALDQAAESTAPALELQRVIDNIMAFRGSYDDYIDDENIRNTIKCGASVERISLYLMLGYHCQAVEKELGRLLVRLERTKLAADPAALKLLWDCHLAGTEASPGSAGAMIHAVEKLFIL